MPAEIKIEEVGPCKKRLKFVVPNEDLKGKLEESYKELVSTVALPGFRRGRVPRKLVEKRFGDDVKEDVKQKLISESVRDALKKNDLSPVGEAKYENIEFDPEKPFSFEVTFEVLPTFDLPNYKGLKLNRKSAEPTDEDMYNAIQDMRRRAAVMTTVEGSAEKGDVAICDYEVKVGDQTVASAQNAEIAADGMNVVGISPEPVAKLLIGSKAGAKLAGRMKLTDEFSREDLRGKEADIQFTVREVKRAIMPEPNDEFAKKSGFDTMKELNDLVRERVLARKQEWVKADLERQAADELLAAVNVELPLDLLKQQTEENLRMRRLRLMLHGISPEQIEKQKDALQKTSEEEAVRDIKTYQIVGKIAEKERIFATEDDVNEAIAQRAMRRGATPAQLKHQLESEGGMSSLRNEIRHRKVMELLVAQGQIVDVKKSITEAPEEEEEPTEEQKKQVDLSPSDIEPKEEKRKLIVTPEEAMREAKENRER